MRHLLAVSAVALSLGAAPVFAQSSPDAAGAPAPQPGRNITATGRTMPPAGGRAPAPTSAEDGMAKAQKASEARDKAWDTRMRKTMSTICQGC